MDLFFSQQKPEGSVLFTLYLRIIIVHNCVTRLSTGFNPDLSSSVTTEYVSVTVLEKLNV